MSLSYLRTGSGGIIASVAIHSALVLHNINWVSEKGLHSIGLVQEILTEVLNGTSKRNRITRKYISMSAELWGLNGLAEYALTLYGEKRDSEIQPARTRSRKWHKFAVGRSRNSCVQR